MGIPFGANYTHFNPPVNQTQQPGVIYNYHQNKGLIQSQLATMRENGHTQIKIPLYHWAAEENYVPDGFALGLYGSALDDQRMQNLTNLIADIKAAGFEYLEIGFLPAGKTLDPNNWTGDIGLKWVREALFIDSIRPVVQNTGIQKVRLDIVDEGVAANSQPTMLQYSQSLWTWYTTAFWPGGQRCLDATISFVPTIEIMGNLSKTFAGTAGGDPNWPDEIQVHIYGGVNESGWGSAYSVYCGVCDQTAGIPGEITLSVGETYSFRDLTTVAGLLRGNKDRPGRTLTRILCWPNQRPGGNDEMASPPVEGFSIQGDPA